MEILRAGVIFGVTFLVFGVTLTYGFVWDDIYFILKTDVFRDPANLGKFFTTTPWYLAWELHHPYYRPLQPVIILVTSLFSGTHPFGYHALNLIFFGTATWLLALFLKRIAVNPRIQWLTLGIFLIHPIHVEVVAWVLCAAILFSMICFLCCVLISMRLSQSTPRTRTLLITVSWVCYALSVLAYDLSFAIPLALACLDWMNPQDAPQKNKRTLFLEYGGYILITGIVIFVRFYVIHQMGDAPYWQRLDPDQVNIIFSGGLLEKVLAPLNVITRYSHMLILPANLSPDYYFKATQFSFEALASFALMILVSCRLFVHQQAHRKLLILSLAWMLIFFLPASNILPIGGMFADRMLFLSSIGFALWLALGMETVLTFLKTRLPNQHRIVGTLLVGLLLLGFGTKTYYQNKIWENDGVFWLHASYLTPHKPRVHNNLGQAFLAAGYPQKAKKSFEKALELNPDSITAQKKLLSFH